MNAPEPEPLEPTLERAKRTLRSALSEACRADLEHANTGELIHIEEVLAIANEAAKEAVSVRRRLGVERERSAAREVEDADGVRWVVFAVYPSTRSGRPAVSDRFRNGWLSFDSGTETRRLVPVPPDWTALSDQALCELCERAEVSPRRRSRGRAP